MRKVRLCKECGEYISINESDYGHRILSLFEQYHNNHPLVTIDSSEARDYINFNQKFEELAEKHVWFNKVFLIFGIFYVSLNLYFLIIDPYDFQRYANNATTSFIFVKMTAAPYQFYVNLIIPLLFAIILYFEAKKRKRYLKSLRSELLQRYLFLLLFGVLFLVCAGAMYAYGYLLLVDLHILPTPF